MSDSDNFVGDAFNVKISASPRCLLGGKGGLGYNPFAIVGFNDLLALSFDDRAASLAECFFDLFANAIFFVNEILFFGNNIHGSLPIN